MRGAFGKPMGTVARVNIGQSILSVRSRDSNKAHVIEALRRSKMKLPGRQLIIVSRKWGFTKWNREDFEALRETGNLIPDGCHCKVGPALSWAFLLCLVPWTSAYSLCVCVAFQQPRVNGQVVPLHVAVELDCTVSISPCVARN